MRDPEELRARLAKIGGCTDGYCVVTGRAHGMHTNGGCRCWMNQQKMQQLARIVQDWLGAAPAPEGPTREELAAELSNLSAYAQALHDRLADCALHAWAEEIGMALDSAKITLSRLTEQSE